MYLTKRVKSNIYKKYGKSEFDTGYTEAQVALFTHRIAHLTGHLRINKKDLVTRRSLVNMVGQRRKLLDYLKSKNIERYREIIKKLKLRR